MTGIEVRPGFFLLGAWALYHLPTGEALSLFLAALLHEGGHLAALYGFGGRPEKLTGDLGGLHIVYAGAEEGLPKALIAAAGPAASFLAAIFSARLSGGRLPFFSGLNLALALFNLLPLSPLDGGRVLSAAAESLFGPVWAWRLSLWADAALLTAMLLLSLILLLRRGGSPAFPVLTAILLGICCKKWRNSVK